MSVKEDPFSHHSVEQSKDICLACLRGTLTDQDIDPEILEQAMQKLVYTGGMGFVSLKGLSSANPAIDAAFRGHRDFFRATAMRTNHKCLQLSAKVSACLSEQGIKHLIAKGPLRQKQVYGDAFVRPSGDTDIVVRPVDFGRTIQTLIKNGYHAPMTGPYRWWNTSFQGQLHFVAPDTQNWSIDLHKRVTQPETENPPDSISWVDEAEFIANSGVLLPIPNGHHAHLISVLNIVKSMYRRPAQRDELGWRRTSVAHVCDLYTAFKDASPQEVEAFLATAERDGLLASAVMAFRVVEAVFQHPFPEIQARRPGMLERFDDAEIVNMVLEPMLVKTWLTPHQLLAELCRGAPVKLARHLAWYLASVLIRRAVTAQETLTGFLGKSDPNRA